MTLSHRATTLFTAIAFAVPQLHAQAPVNPQAPTIGFPSSLGAARGSNIELTLTGTNLAHPTGLHTSFPHPVSLPLRPDGIAPPNQEG